jgi:hypothetical protein
MDGIARCQCEAFRAVVSGEPELVHLCHCQSCRRRTGTIVHLGAYYPRARVRIEARSTSTPAKATRAEKSGSTSARPAARRSAGWPTSPPSCAASLSGASPIRIFRRRPTRSGRNRRPAGLRCRPACRRISCRRGRMGREWGGDDLLCLTKNIVTSSRAGAEGGGLALGEEEIKSSGLPGRLGGIEIATNMLPLQRVGPSETSVSEIA